MTLYEALYLAAIIGGGMGFAIGMAQRHGVVGFIGGFLIGASVPIVLLSLFRLFSRKKPHS